MSSPMVESISYFKRQGNAWLVAAMVLGTVQGAAITWWGAYTNDALGWFPARTMVWVVCGLAMLIAVAGIWKRWRFAGYLLLGAFVAARAWGWWLTGSFDGMFSIVLTSLVYLRAAWVLGENWPTPQAAA